MTTGYVHDSISWEKEFPFLSSSAIDSMTATDAVPFPDHVIFPVFRSTRPQVDHGVCEMSNIIDVNRDLKRADQQTKTASVGSARGS